MIHIFSIIAAIAVFASFTFLIFYAPPKNIVFRAVSEPEAENIKSYLRSNGIDVYVKSIYTNRVDPHPNDGAYYYSVHVINQTDFKRALELISRIG